MPSQDYNFKTLSSRQGIIATAHWAEKQLENDNAIAIAFHGGGFTVGSKDMIPAAQIEELNNSGFVVISADYRLCPQVSLFEGPIEDAVDAYQWCKSELSYLLEKDANLKVDPKKIVAVGYSAGGLLALYLGGLPNPPCAILDFYGAKFLKDKFWFAPLPVLASIPPFPESFLNKIWDEEVISTTAASLERSVAVPPPSEGKPKSLLKPDLSIPRNAWLFDALKRGTHMKEIVKDGIYERVDPVQRFSSDFPPTFFIHGTSDDFIVHRLSVAAYDRLQELGVESQMALVEGQPHGFDSFLTPSDPDYKFVSEGLAFLTRYV